MLFSLFFCFWKKNKKKTTTQYTWTFLFVDVRNLLLYTSFARSNLIHCGMVILEIACIFGATFQFLPIQLLNFHFILLTCTHTVKHCLHFWKNKNNLFSILLTYKAYAVKPCLHFLKNIGEYSMTSKNSDETTT